MPAPTEPLQITTRVAPTLPGEGHARWGVCIALACITAAFLAACSSASDESRPTREGVVTLEFWQISYNTEEVILPILAKFQEENPHIRVRPRRLAWSNAEQQILIALASGLPPDLCEIPNSWVSRFVHEGVLHDLTEATEDMRDGFVMWEPGMLDGRYYAIPWLVSTRLLFINDDLMERAGYPSGTVPVTWDDLLEASRRIQALGPDIHGFGMQAGDPYSPWQRFNSLALTNGAQVLSDDGQGVILQSHRMVEALELWASLADHALIDKSAEIDRAFGEGRLGMTIGGPWLFRFLPSRYPDLRYSTALIPRPDRPGGVHASFLGGEMLVVFGRSRHPEEATRLAKFIADARQSLPIALNERNVLPASKEGYSHPHVVHDPLLHVFMKQIQMAVPAPAHHRWSSFERILSQMVEEILLLGERDVPALTKRYTDHLLLRLSE